MFHNEDHFKHNFCHIRFVPLRGSVIFSNAGQHFNVFHNTGARFKGEKQTPSGAGASSVAMDEWCHVPMDVTPCRPNS